MLACGGDDPPYTPPPARSALAATGEGGSASLDLRVLARGGDDPPYTPPPARSALAATAHGSLPQGSGSASASTSPPARSATRCHPPTGPHALAATREEGARRSTSSVGPWGDDPPHPPAGPHALAATGKEGARRLTSQSIGVSRAGPCRGPHLRNTVRRCPGAERSEVHGAYGAMVNSASERSTVS